MLVRSYSSRSLLKWKQIAALLGQVFFDGVLVGFDQAEAAIQMVERQPGRGISSSSGKAVPGSQW